MRWTRWSLATIAAALAACPGPARGDRVTGFNEDSTLLAPAVQANDFEIVLPGLHTFENFRFGFPGSTAGATPVFNPGTGTTTLTFSGLPITPSTVTAPNTRPGELHFGYTVTGVSPNAHGFGPPDTLSKIWTFNGVAVQTETTGFTASITPVGPQTAPVRYLVMYAGANVVGGAPGQFVADWAAIPYLSNTLPLMQFSNSSSQNLQIFQAEYLFLTPGTGGLPLESDPGFGDALLGMLNNQFLPPTDPRFTSLGIADGTVVLAGQTVPEPSTWALTGLGTLALLAHTRRRRRLSCSG